MIETKTKTIGATTYTVTQFGAKRGRQVLLRLVKMIGPAIGELATLAGGPDAKKNLEASLSKVVATFAECATVEDFDYLCDSFAKETRIEMLDAQGRTVQPLLSDLFDMHFAGQYLEMIQWLVFAVEVNYMGFFDAARMTSPSAGPSAAQAKA